MQYASFPSRNYGWQITCIIQSDRSHRAAEVLKLWITLERKESPSKLLENRRQQQIKDKLYCTFVYSRTDKKHFEFIQNWLLNASSISILEFPRFVFNTLKFLKLCGCHQNIFFRRPSILSNYSYRHSFLLMVLLSVINRCYIKYKCFIKSADDKSTICAKPPVKSQKDSLLECQNFQLGCNKNHFSLIFVFFLFVE